MSEDISTKVSVICIVPVKNEAWILKNFIEAAQKWADLIIIGDHNSVDNSVKIAQQYDHVRVIPLHFLAFDAGTRRMKLLEEARKVEGRRLILVIDTDEMISANWAHSSEWNLMLNAEPGTRFQFDWVEILPGLQQAAIFNQIAAFVDDMTEYTGGLIHEPRTPSTHGEIVRLNEIKLLHYIAVDPERMFSKHRWYKCVEYLEVGKRPWAICITYQDTKIKSYDAPIIPIQEKWINGFSWLDEYKSSSQQPNEKCYWWDEEILNYFDLYGVKKFRKLNIWDVDWNMKAQMLGRKGIYDDPRSGYEKMIHRFIETHREDLKTKHTIPMRAFRLSVKTALRVLGW